MVEYKKRIEKIISDSLDDLSSFRVHLIIAAYLFNIFTLYLIGWRHTDYKLGVASIGLLTTVYGAFFVSKHFENKNQEEENEDNEKSKEDPLKDVN